MSIEFITNEQIYKKVIEPIAKAKSFVWMGTSDLKDLHVHHNSSVQSLLKLLNDLTKNKVAIHLLHAKKPGENFRRSGLQLKQKKIAAYNSVLKNPQSNHSFVLQNTGLLLRRLYKRILSIGKIGTFVLSINCKEPFSQSTLFI